jgi:hypothetical protein
VQFSSIFVVHDTYEVGGVLLYLSMVLLWFWIDGLVKTCIYYRPYCVGRNCVQFSSIFVLPNTYDVGDVLLVLSMVFDGFV